MSKKEGNNFEKLCKKIEECQYCRKDGIKCAKHILINEINGNRLEFLKYKAECNDGDYNVFLSTILGIIAIVISIYAMLLSYIMNFINLSDTNQIILYLTLITFLAPSFFAIYGLRKVISRNYVKKWRKYISVVLEDIDINWDKYFEKNKLKVHHK